MSYLQSPAEWLAQHPERMRREMAKLTEEEKAALNYDWEFWARPSQLAPPGDWATWIALAGRGFGKTEAGTQWVRQRVRQGARMIALVAETQKDLEEVMVPRLINVHPPEERPVARFKPVRLTWPNGAMALGYNGTEPNQLRGPEFDTAWVDELAKYRYAQELWDMLQFTMRRGADPRVFVSTTPRPIPVIREIVRDPSTVVTRGSSYENRANLPKQFLDRIKRRYEGTRLGRQELMAEILDDLPGALWARDAIDEARIRPADLPDMRRVVVAVDPSGTGGEEDDGDSIGIVVAGLGVDKRGYVLADLTCKLSPDGWGRRAVEGYRRYHADRIVAERNFGGAMVQHVIKTVDRLVPFKEVVASRGKVVRAEPVAALYEQGRVSHVGSFADLEDQMCLFGTDGYLGEGSPDRVDACLAAGTLVETLRGPVPIESVRVGDMVLTREGYSPVEWAGMTRESAETTAVSLSSGQLVEATGEHPFWTLEYGFRPCSDLAEGDTVLLLTEEHARWARSLLLRSSTEDTSTGATQRAADGRTESTTGAEREEDRSCTETSGPTPTVRSQEAGTSTTGTGTPSTTTSQISSACLHESTQSSTPRESERRGTEPTSLPTPSLRQPSGIGARREGSGTESTGRGLGRAESPSMSSRAQSVASRSGLTSRPEKALASAQKGAAEQGSTERGAISPSTSALSAEGATGIESGAPESRLAPASVARLGEKRRQAVYNLHVRGPNEFFANGVLVHNCVWALTELMVDGSRPSILDVV